MARAARPTTPQADHTRRSQQQHATASEWTRLALKRAARTARRGIMLILLALALWGLTAISHPESTGIPLSAAIALILAALGLWQLAAARLVRRYLIPLATRTGYALCPYCLEPLDPDEPDDTTFYCGRCNRDYSRHQLETWWRTWAEKGHNAACATLTSHIALWHGPDPIRRAVTLRHPIAFYAVAMLALLTFVIGLYGGHPLVALMRGYPTLLSIPMTILLTEVWALTRQRIGREWRCARCGYQRAPDGPNPVLCPECGAVWGPEGTLVRGRPRLRSSIALLITILTVALLFPLMLSVRTATTLMLRLVPDVVLVDAARTSGQPMLWKELYRRTLSPAQRRRLARLLIRRYQSSHPPIDARAASWLASHIQAGTLDADLTDAFLNACIAVRLTTPPVVAAGSQLDGRISVTIVNRFALAPLTTGMYVVLESLTANGQPLYPPVPGTWQAIPPRAFGSHIALRWVPDTPGRYTLRARVVVALGPGPGGARYADHGLLHTRQPDGSFALPPGTLWSHRYELTRQVVVRPTPTSAPALQP